MVTNTFLEASPLEDDEHHNTRAPLGHSPQGHESGKRPSGGHRRNEYHNHNFTDEDIKRPSNEVWLAVVDVLDVME
jgi:hypothetical protein